MQESPLIWFHSGEPSPTRAIKDSMNSRSGMAGQLKNRLPYSFVKISALDDGLEPVGFELLSRTRRGLVVRIRPDLNAIVFVRAGRDDKGGKFFLLQGLREGQRVILVQHGSDLEHDRAFRNQRTIRARCGF